MACVACGNENVQKVSAIVKAGTWAQNSVGNTIGAAYMGGGHAVPFGSVTTTNTSGASQIAQTLAPPAQPQKGNYGGYVVLAIVLGIFASCLHSILKDETVILFLAFTSLEIVVVAEIFSEVRKRKAYPMAFQQWQQAMYRWDQLFYCPRCDCICNPQTRQSAPAHAMHTLL